MLWLLLSVYKSISIYNYQNVKVLFPVNYRDISEFCCHGIMPRPHKGCIPQLDQLITHVEVTALLSNTGRLYSLDEAATHPVICDCDTNGLFLLLHGYLGDY